ncbi:hypothetical protein KUCAC02_000846 [Chaenocephalus aceratus]|uniref:Uncharacterized protein n=1 Tax=Chaenocephalus aceratus TaxID=36190 RepID=A0ACB9W8B2_CHAAC|nr:hypothetical protein KUCAC02_000846 [Chaenocephalus aceratus]
MSAKIEVSKRYMGKAGRTTFILFCCLYVCIRRRPVWHILHRHRAQNSDPEKRKQPLTPLLTSIGTSTFNLYIGDNDHSNIDVGQTSNGMTGNVWWHTLRSFLQAAGQNGSCYACTLFPQDSSMSVPVRPRSLTQVEHLCAFMALTRPIKVEDSVTEWRYARQLPPPCSNRSNSSLRASTLDTTYAKYQPVSHVHPSHLRGMKHNLCIQRVYHKTSLTPPYFPLGTTTGCTRILLNTCGDGAYKISYCHISGAPERILSNVAFPDVKHISLQLAWPSDAGFSAPEDYVWLCGNKLYQVLAPLWIGTCTLVDLNPAVTVLTSLMHTTHHYPEFQHPDHHKVKRDMTSAGAKFMGGLFPWWGTVNNAHKINTLHVRLENLTYETTQGFQALTPFIIASRNMLMQHQFALWFASKGGLCHVIGDSCCTYIPDATKNITDTVLHLNNLLAFVQYTTIPLQDNPLRHSEIDQLESEESDSDLSI